MGETQLTFKRYEKKYLLSAEQYEAFMADLKELIEPDMYYGSTVCSIYYDSDDFSLIRRSIDAPIYKEKLRLRSYNVPGENDSVFIELKKKYKGIVYKRRVSMRARDAVRYLAGEAAPPEDSQMIHEIDWFMRMNKPSPKAFIACDRLAYRANDNHELRITFDKNLRWRDTELELTAGSHGTALIDEDIRIMEIKIPGTAPMWLAELLSKNGIFPTGFSKYGSCYVNNILEKYLNGVS